MRKKVFAATAAFLLTAFILLSFLEKPSIKFTDESRSLGMKPFTVDFSGVGKGLKSIKVVYKGENETLLLETKNYPEGVEKDSVKISLSPFSGIEDGPAKIKATAVSYGGGIRFGEPSAEKTKNVLVDLSPPKITVLSGAERILQGGSVVAVYRVSEDATESGVKIGDSFFKGHKAAPGSGFSDKNIRIAFFSYPYDMPEGETVLISAVDSIGNRRNLPISYSLEKIDVKDVEIPITERFIKMKMFPLLSSAEKTSLRETFMVVNKKIRSANNKKISKILSRTSSKIMWEGSFIRPVGSLKAGFEKRKYIFEGGIVDEQTHLGYDFASRKKNPVRASNSGVVVFADDIGIYGNTIIIDHGMGISTLYSHLSSMSIQRGDKVKKGDIIGNTGSTGLAFGDHLHFGMYVGEAPVVPFQWWDPFWVQTRITDNIAEAQRLQGQ